MEKNITLHQLHKVIQVVMGWKNYHLYEFTIGGRDYQDDEIDEAFDLDDEGLLPSRKYELGILKLKQKFNYTYDFGDSWEHLLVVEKILPKESTVSYPVCLEGERNCPPEDCGSVPGYYHLMAVRKNQKHSEYKELIKDWLCEGYKPEYFNAREVNADLKQMFAKKREKKPGSRTGYWVLSKTLAAKSA